MPFAGCVFVAPSKMCQPRVKTFEELPLEVHPQKAPQVSSLCPHQLLKMWTGWWHFENASRLWGTFSSDNFRISRRIQTQALRSCPTASLPRTTRQIAGWFWPPKNWRELNTSRREPSQRGESNKSCWSVSLSETESSTQLVFLVTTQHSYCEVKVRPYPCISKGYLCSACSETTADFRRK